MKILNKIKTGFDNKIKKIEYFMEEKFGSGYKATIFISKIIASFLLSGISVGYIYDSRIPTALWILEWFLIFFAGLTVAQWMLGLGIKIFRKVNLIELTALFLMGYCAYLLMRQTLSIGKLESYYIYIISLVFALVQWIFSRSIWAILKNKKINRLTLCLLIFTTIVNIGIIKFLSSSGFVHPNRGKLLSVFRDMGGEKSFEIEGEYTPLYVDYGQEEGIKTNSVSLTSFASYSGINKKIRDFYWKRSLSNVPVRGRIWYPQEVHNAPVLFIVHGNHRMTEENHKGYDYLGEFLATEGYVTVSVDENMLNGFLLYDIGNENDARAVLLLENIKAILKLNDDKESPLYKRINKEEIVLAGHSRGGEAAAIAAYFNTLDRYPDNGNRKFDYNYNIKAVAGISPTFGQYKPAGHKLQLKDINYFLIHGSHDQDINTYQGIKQYYNLDFSKQSNNFKVSLYLAYANHGQFNSLWGVNDRSQPAALMLNTKDFLSSRDQEKILCIYMLSFLNATLKDGDRGIFLGNELYSDSLPKTLYFSQYEDASFKPINDYEEDSNIESATLPGGTNIATGVQKWNEKLVKYSIGSGDSDNHALNIKYSGKNGKYSTKIEEFPFEDSKYIQFNLMNNRRDNDIVDFQVELVDSLGERAQLFLKDYILLYPGFPVGMLKLQHVFKEYEYKHQFQSVRIPLEDFKDNNKKFNYKTIREINFLFNQNDSGDLTIDKVGFSK